MVSQSTFYDPSGKNIDGPPRAELVALLTEPMNVGLEFVQGAVRQGLGVDVPIGKPDSTEFVTGKLPIYFIQTGGRLFQLKFIPLPYFAEQCRPYVNGDPDTLMQAAQDANLQCVVDEHQAWISVALMNAEPGKESAPYEDVGKMMGALIIVSEATAIVWPAESRIRNWDFDLMEYLDGGNPLSIFE